MKNKLVFLILFISVLLGLGIIFSVKSDRVVLAPKDSFFLQVPPKDENTYYWFDIRVRTNSRDKHYKIISASSKVLSGSIKKFQKYLWRNLANRKIAVGPFLYPQDADKALLIYKGFTQVKTVDDLRKLNIPNFGHEVYWFSLKLTQSERLRYYVFEHNPARVESGTARQFVDALFQTLQYQQVAIGPFEAYDRTEEIKRMYRQNE